MDIIHMSSVQIKRQLISSRFVMFAVLLIFVKGFVADPLIQAIKDVEAFGDHYRISFLQPIICLNNSFMLSLLMPLMFIVLAAGLPGEQNFDLFLHIRTTKRRFFLSQILTVAELAVSLTLLMLLASGTMVAERMGTEMEYCGAVTRYNTYFPDRTGEYVLTLIPPNLYNQESFIMAFLHSAALLTLEFMLIGLVLLFFAETGLKFVGLVSQVILIAVSAILTNADIPAKWLLPTAHTTLWLHKDVILEKEIFPMLYSYIYFAVLIIIFLILIFIYAPRYELRANR